MGKAFARQTPAADQKEIPDLHEEPQNKGVLPNSIVMRVMQDGAAEDEADRLSAGVNTGSLSGVKSEMGSRLGADFSGVRFHSDAASRARGDAMGARAWTRGSDVYFGSGGFEPGIAAHELVHTVQQGAVRGETGVSMPTGAVQMKPKKEEKNKKATAADFQEGEYQGPIAGDLNGLADVENRIVQTLSRGRGLKVYHQIEPDIKNLIRNIKAAKKIKYTPRGGVSFMVRAAYQDYAMRDILKEMAGKSVGLFKVGTRVRQYKALLQGLRERLGEYQAEELAIQTGMLQGAPKYEHDAPKRKVSKRSYQYADEGGEAASFNPGNIPEVAKIQQEIDNAETFQDAYKAFAKFTGNKDADVDYMRETDEGSFTPDLILVKNKLKNMARMVWDYPELRGTIGNLKVMKTDMKEKMGTIATYGGRRKSPIYYNVYKDREGEEADMERRQAERFRDASKDWNGDWDHAGNHELGHILANNFVADNSSKEAAKQANERHETENDILKEVLLNGNILTPKQKKGIKFFKKKGKYKSSYGNDIEYTKGEMDTMHSPVLQDRNITSNYGRNAAFEFFAETFSDVYTHGKGAKKASIATVQEYEKRQKKLQADRWKYRQSGGFMRMFRKKV